MPREIDQIISLIQAEIPGSKVTQLQVTHPADDDGVWFIYVQGRAEKVQLESSSGSCPFIIESNFSPERLDGHSITDVVSKVRSLYGT